MFRNTCERLVRCAPVPRLAPALLLHGRSIALLQQQRRSLSLFGAPLEQSFSATRVVPFSRSQIFDVVADVDRYHEFLPFCVRSEVLRRVSARQFEAELELGFHAFNEAYTSIVNLDAPRAISIRSKPSPVFSWLISNWRFTAADRSCLVDFNVNFRVESRIHAQVLAGIFQTVADSQMAAFEKRCAQMARMSEEKRAKALDEGYSLEAFLRQLAAVETVPVVAAPRYAGAALHVIFDVDEDGLAEAAATPAGAAALRWMRLLGESQRRLEAHRLMGSNPQAVSQMLTKLLERVKTVLLSVAKEKAGEGILSEMMMLAVDEALIAAAVREVDTFLGITSRDAGGAADPDGIGIPPLDSRFPALLEFFQTEDNFFQSMLLYSALRREHHHTRIIGARRTEPSES